MDNGDKCVKFRVVTSLLINTLSSNYIQITHAHWQILTIVKLSRCTIKKMFDFSNKNLKANILPLLN